MKRVLIFCLIFILVCTSYNFAFATNLNENQKKVYSFENDVTLTGVNTNYSKFFKVDNMWNVSDVTLNLVISQSELINEAESNLSVYINGVAIHSLKLSEKKGYKSSISIKVPIDKIKKSFNELTIKGTRRITDKPCSDDYNVANWLVINKESNINVSFVNVVSENILSTFPYPYLKSQASNPALNILVPKDFTSFEGEAALRLTSYISSNNKDEDVKVNIINTFNSEIFNNDFICIGRYTSLPNEIKALVLDKDLPLIKDKVLINQVVSPYNSSKKILIVTSLNDQMLINGVKYLSNKNLTLQTSAPSTLVDGQFNANTLKEPNSNNITFNKLGYGSMNFVGPFKHTANYIYTLPKNNQIDAGGKIHINCSYSKNIDFDKSILSVEINGVPAGSKRLEEAEADGDILEVTIPESLGKKSVYNINVSFNLEVKDVYCDFSNKETPYAYISNTSYLNMPTKKIENPKLGDFPSPFISNGEYNSVTFVVDSYNIDSLNYSASIASYIGKSLNYNTGNIKLKIYSDLSDSEKKGNIIAIGTPKNNKIISEVGNKLHIKYNSEYTGFANNDKVQLNEEYSKNLTSVQIIPSPFNSKNSIMLITSPKEELINKGVLYLSSILKTSKLSEDASLIDSNLNVTNFKFTDDKKIDKSNSDVNTWVGNNTKVFIIFVSIIVISLISGYIFIKKKYKK